MPSPAKSGAFFNRNQLAQEVFTAVIAMGTAIIFAARDLEEIKPYLILISGLVALGVGLKIGVYRRILEFNKAKTRIKRATPNHLCHEITTATIFALAGLYLVPVIKCLFAFDRYPYPDHHLSLALVLICLIVKILVYARVLNWNALTATTPGQPWLYPPFFSVFFNKYSGPPVLQIATALVLGLMIGLYLYESRIIFKPAEWYPARYQEVYEEPSALITLFGDRGIQEAYRVRSFSQVWNDPRNQFYLELGIAVACAALFLKLFLYFFQPLNRAKLAAMPQSKAPPRPTSALASARQPQPRSKTGAVRSGVSPNFPVANKAGKSATTGQPVTTSGRSQAGSKEIALSRTQEHQIPVRAKSVSRTQEHRIAGYKSGALPPTQEHKLSASREYRLDQTLDKSGELFIGRNATTAALWPPLLYEPILLGLGSGIGLLILPAIRNGFLHQRAVYPFGLFGFGILIALGVFGMAHIVKTLEAA